MDYFKQLWILLFVMAGGKPSLEVVDVSTDKTIPRDRTQYRDGDIILGGAMQVTWQDESGNCIEEITGMQLVETVNMIIDKVNADDSILPGVKLGSIMIDTCSSESHALQRVIMDILPLALAREECLRNCTDQEPEPILAGILGASLSSVSMQLARILQVFRIPQVSYWSTSIDLSDKGRFKYFFRSVPPDVYQVDAMLTFAKQMGWDFISVIYEDDNYGVDGYSEIVRVAEEYNICIAVSKALPRNVEDEDMALIVRELLSKPQSKAVIMFTHAANTDRLFSAAQPIPEAKNLVWIGSDGWTGYIPRNGNSSTYLDILDGAIGFFPKISATPQIGEYMLNLTLGQNYGTNASRNPWFPDYISKRNNCTLPEEPTAKGTRVCSMNESIDPESFRPFSIPISDAVYAFVYALDSYHRYVCEGKSGLCDELKGKGGTAAVADELLEYLKNVSFTAADGTQFQFDKNHDGPPVYEAQVFLKDRLPPVSENLLEGWTKAGLYRNRDIHWFIDLPEKLSNTISTCSAACDPGKARIQGTQKCCWQCIPCASNEFVDNVTSCQPCNVGFKPDALKLGCEALPIRQMEYKAPHSLFALIFGIIGLICTLYVTGTFIRHSETAIVRASGKELCFFVLFGIILTLINCFTVMSNPTQASCAASRVILAIGPTCMYVGLLMKTIRVVFIFQSKGILSKKTKHYLQPLQFILVTVAVTSIQAVIVAIWLVLKRPHPELLYFEDFSFLSCKVLVDIEILIGLVFPFLIIIICTVLATINRNVPTGFRETLYVGFTMYTTCVIWLAFLPIFLTNSTDVPKKLATVSIALTLSALTVLFCLFGPRCFAILFHPEWNTTESVMSRPSSTSKQRCSTVCGTAASMRPTQSSMEMDERRS